jgi:hypothetical protein
MASFARAAAEAWGAQRPGATRARPAQTPRASQGARPPVRVCHVAGWLLVAWLLPATALAQVSTSTAISRRPWVGFWLGGSGTFHTELPRGGLDTQLSLDLPMDRTGGLRVAAGRAWANEDGLPELSIQRLVVYALGERVFYRGVCVNAVYGGLGAGLYFYDFADLPERIRRVGYQALVGSSCTIGRISTSVEMHGRRINNPGLATPRDRGVTVIDLLFGVRVRL